MFKKGPQTRARVLRQYWELSLSFLALLSTKATPSPNPTMAEDLMRSALALLPGPYLMAAFSLCAFPSPAAEPAIPLKALQRKCLPSTSNLFLSYCDPAMRESNAKNRILM